VPDAVIAFDFDPLLQVGDGFVRLETIGVAVAIFAALVIAGAIARRMGLRGDDLLFVVLGVVPGAVIGGRIGYVLLHPAFFGADPGRILDPSAGSLELTLGVVGGALTGAMVAACRRRPGRWLHLRRSRARRRPPASLDDPRRVGQGGRRRATWRRSLGRDRGLTPGRGPRSRHRPSKGSDPSRCSP
jgi:hypothetical protein